MTDRNHDGKEDGVGAKDPNAPRTQEDKDRLERQTEAPAKTADEVFPPGHPSGGADRK